MSRGLRSSSSVVDDVVDGLDLRSRETCTFLTFGKVPMTPRSAVVPPTTIGNTTRVQPPTTMMSSATNVGAYSAGNGRERKSSTETGPSDPSAVRPGSGGSESTSRARYSSPDDEDDVFSVADVGCSSFVSSRSISVPPRRTRSCAQPVVVSEVPPSNAATVTVVSPPRMKRRKKKNVPESETESRKAGMSMSLGRNNSVLPVAARCNSNKVTEVAKMLPENNRDSTSSRCGDTLPTEQPASEVRSCRENSSTSGEAETKRKKNIRWKTDVAQSSPDVASDDADSKESGYITLEDLQAQLGLSSWSSDERQTDQDVFSSSGDELRVPEGLRGAELTSSMSSAFGAPSTDLLLPLPSSSSFLSPLVPPEQFDTFGGGIDGCRSAPPTCDASLLKFTFTVRLDSKMFHRRAANKSVRRHPPLMMLTDVQERGWSGTSTHRDKERSEPANSRSESNETDDQARAVENARSQVAENHCISLPTSESLLDTQKTQISSAVTPTTASKLPEDSAFSSPSGVQQFAGEKVVVRAEVHRSADQLDADPPKSSNVLGAASNSQKLLKTKSSAVQVGTSLQKTTKRTTDRALSASCQPDDVIVSCSPDAEFLNRQCSMTQSLHHDRSDKVADGGFNGRLNYVDVDRVVSQTAKRQTFDRQQSSTSAVSQRSNKFSDGLTLTLRKPAKLRQSDRCVTDVKTRKEKKANEASACRNQRRTDGGGASSKVQSTTDASRRTHRYFSCDRTRTGGRIFSESSSLSSDSEPDICGPCITKDSTAMAMAACTRGCPANCSRHAGKTGIAKTVDGRLLKTSNEGSIARRSKSTRRALRQFFRVENLFACRHGRSSSDRYSSRDDEQQAIGCTEETSKKESCEDASRGGSESTTCRGRCGRSVTQSTLQSDQPGPRTCRRSRPSRSSRRTDSGRGEAASAASRSVSPHARSRCRSRAADERTAAAGTCCRTASRHRSTDRSSTVDRLHVWNGVESSSTPAAANNDLNGRGGQRWNTLCVSPSDNSILTESGCGFSSRRRVLATTPISPSTPAPENLHTATIGNTVVFYCSISCLLFFSSVSLIFCPFPTCRLSWLYSLFLAHHT